MIKALQLFFFLINTGFAYAQQFSSVPSQIKWRVINTGSSRVIFPSGLDSQANRVVNMMNLFSNTTSATIGGKQRKWNIVLQNQTTIPNAYVTMGPIRSELFMTPGQDNFSLGSIPWTDNLIIHENRHMQQFSNFNHGLTKAFTLFGGQRGQLLANLVTIPDFFFEGDAVWQETLVTAQGRGRMPSFYNTSKAIWQSKKHYSWMQMRNGSYRNILPDKYTLGYQVIGYGYEKFGNDFWQKVTRDAARFKGIFYPFNKAVRRYSGLSYGKFCEMAVEYFKERSLAPDDFYSQINYITGEDKKNVTNYFTPLYVSDDTILVSKSSGQERNTFCLLANGHEKKIRVRDFVIDNYYSYKNGLLVYSTYSRDPRWAYKNYSDISLLNIYTGKQINITRKAKYFSPDISFDGKQIVAVHVSPGGTNVLHLVDVASGKARSVPNQENLFFTQTKFLNDSAVISAARITNGQMALVKVDLYSGKTVNLTDFTFNVLGYPFIRGDTIFFNMMDSSADKVFALIPANNKLFRLTSNANAVYYPAVNGKNEIVFSVFTQFGLRLAAADYSKLKWEEVSATATKDLYTSSALEKDYSKLIYEVKDTSYPSKPYKRSSHLFNFHSRSPIADDPEYGYVFYSDNILNTFTSDAYYLYNRAEKSHAIGVEGIFGGWYPLLSAGLEGEFNRSIDTSVGKPVGYNSATLQFGISVPLRIVSGRTIKSIGLGIDYKIEQPYQQGVAKNIFRNRSIDQLNFNFTAGRAVQAAPQNIFPKWSQNLSLNYKKALNFWESHKFIESAVLFFPGLSPNHSLVLAGAYQKRDSLPDLFKNTFPYSKGYQALSTRRMYKASAEYHFPLAYPDWGFANLMYFLRIRGAVFYDHTNALARLNGILTDIQNRSTGVEIYFDNKLWNELPISIGIRFSHLLDTDLINPATKNTWEIIAPVAL